MKSEAQIREQYRQIRDSLDERGRREWAASEAMALGRGGIALVHRGTGIVPSTIGKGIRELRERSSASERVEQARRVRRRGGGRPRKVVEDPQLLGALEALVEPSTRSDPQGSQHCAGRARAYGIWHRSCAAQVIRSVIKRWHGY